MKVTVCFGAVRVVVPCGDGILVRDLIRESIVRYKKATGKGAKSWVAVRNFKSQGGGILDPDDRLSDVVDDREQIFVSFESDDVIHHHVGGDGTSGSSDGTGSPELFKDLGRKYGYHKIHRCSLKARTDIEVTGTNLANGNQNISTLQVRRGSEPNLTQIEQPKNTTMVLIRNKSVSDHTKRWSAAPLIVDSQPPQLTWEQELNSNSIKKSTEMCEENADRFWRFSHGSTLKEVDDSTTSGFTYLPKNKNRLSMQFTTDGNGNNLTKPIERTNNSKTKATSKSLHGDQQRKEPLGQANSATSSPTSAIELDLDRSELIVIRNDAGPLGMHVIPDYDHHGKDKGLLVQGIDPDGRVYHDGRIALYDRIIEINGENLLNLPFQRVQEMFKLSVISPELSLRIIRCARSGKPPPPVFPTLSNNKENAALSQGLQKCDTINMNIATVSPTKKLVALTRNQKSLLIVNTRKIGRKIELELTKAPPPHGLGFSITTRDNPAGGNCPIYIKNIIPKGAAIKDGRLKIGDRLLEVNDVEMTGKSQSEAVSVLRNVTAGSKVRIVVSRQEDVPNTECPRIINSDTALNSCVEPNYNDAFDHHSSQCSILHSNDIHGSSNLNPCLPTHHSKHLLQQHLIPNRLKDVANSMNVSNEIYSQPLDIFGDVSSFPWKYKHIITLDIPVHDSEKAGLGISVKGKTSGCQDLGIFIKSVIHGGAASRDQRLRTNDQLLNVNNISLLYQSNSDAMETLRKAMLHAEGPVPGNITLTIARKAPIPNYQTHLQQNSFLNSNNHDYMHGPTQLDIHKLNKTVNGSLDSVHDSINEQDQDSSGKVDFNHSKLRYMEDFQQSSSYITNTMTQKGNLSATTVIFDSKIGHADVAMNTWNPVLNKLAGNSNKQLRNESYYKWLPPLTAKWFKKYKYVIRQPSCLLQYIYSGVTNSRGVISATNQCDVGTSMIPGEILSNHIIETPFGETFLMEDEYGSRLPLHKSTKSNLLERTNRSSYFNLLSSKTPTTLIVSSNGMVQPKSASSTTVDIRQGCDKVITTVPISDSSLSPKACLSTEIEYVNQFSMRNSPTGFSRDAFGRQSMSEKRHAALDAKSTDTYQRSKKMREKRGKNKSVIDTHILKKAGPFLGMKKSSSLESLETMVREKQQFRTQLKEGESIQSYAGRFEVPIPFGVFRDENCKQRLPTEEREISSTAFMDPDHHSKISAKKHWLLDPPTDFHIENGFNAIRGTPRQSSLNPKLSGKPKHGKKKSGLLKGFGIMFR